jgi:hypothetical protein
MYTYMYIYMNVHMCAHISVFIYTLNLHKNATLYPSKKDLESNFDSYVCICTMCTYSFT